MKKFTLVIIVVTMMIVISLFAACSNEAENNDTKETTATKVEKTTSTEATTSADTTTSEINKEEILEVTWLGFNIAGYLPNEDAEIKKTLEDRFNISIEDVNVDVHNKEQYNVLIASSVEFDINTNRTNFVTFNDLGLIRSIPENFLSEYLPVQYDELVDMFGDNWKIYASIDKEIYGIPVISEAWTAPVILGVRNDWITAVGYDDDYMPKTLDELETMLYKLHSDDPDKNGEQDTYAIGRFDDLNAYVFGAYGISDRYWYNDEEGNPQIYSIDENYKEALKVLQRWYEKGIFDPEIVTDKRPETTTKFIQNKVGGYYGIDWAFTLGHTISPIRAAQNEGLDIEIKILEPVTGPTGKTFTSQFNESVSTDGMTFGRNCSDEKLIRLLKVINTIYSEEDLFKYVFFGPKEKFYTEDEEGYMQTTDFYTKENMYVYGSQRYLNFNFTPKSIFNWRTVRDRLEVFYSVQNLPKVEINPISILSTDAEVEYGASVNKIVDEFYWKAITGELDIEEEWSKYVSNWMEAGGKQIIEQKKLLNDSIN